MARRGTRSTASVGSTAEIDPVVMVEAAAAAEAEEAAAAEEEEEAVPEHLTCAVRLQKKAAAARPVEGLLGFRV